MFVTAGKKSWKAIQADRIWAVTTCCLSKSLGFQILFLRVSKYPVFPSLLFLFDCIMHSFVPPPSFFVPLITMLCPSANPIFSLKKSIFNRIPIILHSCTNSLTFYGHFLLTFFLYTSTFQPPSFPSTKYKQLL